MKALQDLQLFVRIAAAGSLSAAARQLGLTPAAASAALKRLEAELQAPLFVRSTRSLRLTAEGEAFLSHCRQALQLLEEGREAITQGQGTVRGPLQISAPSDLGRQHLLGWLDAFQAEHPQLQLRLQLSDRLARLHREPVDVALRYGEPPDSSLVALPLAPDNRRVLCASPTYLAHAGTPRHPGELAQHNCLTFLLADELYDRWRFWQDGRELAVTVQGDRSSDDGEAVRRWALAHRGIAYKSALDVADDLRAGRLVALCPGWQTEPAPLVLVCASRRQLSLAVRRLRDDLLQRCGALSAGLPAALPG
ncbi:LysR family transcriptional regulator [Ideonella sp. BN130291]|uniref:LysR family transcriptional regulator n=1 Tax=Ideonella sp. BN130291 TaxID=3112940 RepID=UPI002E25A99B|nr:LysR substrate-binding domain-containing protein [Ideonella sp. BN130291]